MRRMSPRELRRLTRRLGLKMEELQGVEEVIIKLRDKRLLIRTPQVLLMNLGGQVIYQIIGEAVEEEEMEEEVVEIREEDLQLVMAQTGASLDEAREALKATKGDIAAAIILIQERRAARTGE